MSQVASFRIEIDRHTREDLRARLARTRWPERETVDGWDQGVPLAFVQDLCTYWSDEYDFLEAEQRLNAFAQYRTEIDGVGVHFIHVRSRHENALPLLVTHGWPGSVLEFAKVIEPLTDPTRHGGDAADAFHVVCPSLPGYGFSDKPEHHGWGPERIALTWARLMARLGYERYGAQGGDWGAVVTMFLTQCDAPRLVGAHFNLVIVPAAEPATAQEVAAAEHLAHFERWEAGYSHLQATRPQTLAYGLADSPSAQCAWIVEKFRSWSDCNGDPLSVFTREELLDNVMMYWLPGAGGSSARLYWEHRARPYDFVVDVSAGCSLYPKEVRRPSLRWAEARFTDIRQWHELPRGGHFAALEQPATFTDEVRSFFRLVR